MTSPAEQAALDEQKLLEDVWAAFNEALDGGTQAPPAAPSAETDGKLDRVVIHNLKSETGFVPIGGVELELEPGRSLTLWLGKGDPAPRLREDDGAGVNSGLVILCDDEPLLG